jgi:glycosyltransferase involved in cell wall biosynthesis
MKICLVTSFPPSRGGLSEYGFHIARELQRDPLLSLTVLADEMPNPEPELEEFSVHRCWSFNKASNPVRLLRAIRKLSPDIVWFNLLFTTFGHNPLAAFCGLTTPMLTRLAGFQTHITLHHLVDVVDMNDANVRFPQLYRVAGGIATRVLLLSNSVSVLMPGYRKILMEKYSGENVHVHPHGILAQRPEYPDFSRRGNPHRILAFGKWGTYKRLESLIAAFGQVSARVPSAKLIIAGTDHPRAAGYVGSLAKKLENDPRVEFTGYVAEHQLPALFGTASVVVMPYSSATGASGVAHLACAYGVPIISADIPDFREMTEEGLAIDFYRMGDPDALAQRLISLLESPERQRQMSEQNFSAALRMTMPRVVHDYLRYFDRARRSRILRPMHGTRVRSSWRGSPTVSMAENWATMAHSHMPLNEHLLDGHGRLSGDLGRRGRSVDGDGVASGSNPSGAGGNIVHRGGGLARAAGAKQDGHANRQQNEAELTHRPPAQLPHSHEARNAEAEPVSGIDRWTAIVSPGDRVACSGDGEDGTRLAGSRSDAVGREGAGETLGEA